MFQRSARSGFIIMSETKTIADNMAGNEQVWGVFYAVMAFVIWGISPIYWKLMKHIPSFEIITHRLVWSFVFLLPLIVIRGRWHEFTAAIKNIRTFGILLITAMLVTTNWFIYVWAVNNEYLLQASLGYYINPLVNVLLGMVFLKERLRPLQMAAVLIACAGVLYQTFYYGQFPWISLALAFSFGFYGLIRKAAPVGSLVGLTVETMLLFIPGVIYLSYLDRMGVGSLFRVSHTLDGLLMFTAVATAVPLLLFALGAKRINLSTVGLIQYIGPSGMFLLAVFAFHEPVNSAQVITFVCIWMALALYSFDTIRIYRRLQEGIRPHPSV
jgi:chloramphenicol-sensitive protein RarD